MSTKRQPFEDRPRPLTKDEAAVARDLLGEPVTPSWLGRREPGSGTLEILRPPALTRTAKRRGFAADLTRWDVFRAPGLDDASLFAATLRRSARWQQRNR